VLDMTVMRQPTAILSHFGKPQFTPKQQFLPPAQDKKPQLHRTKFKEHHKTTLFINQKKKFHHSPSFRISDETQMPENQQLIDKDMIPSSADEIPSTKFVKMIVDLYNNDKCPVKVSILIYTIHTSIC
jgi:hypothetical protein